MEAFIGTPEEYFGAVTYRCEQCGDIFDTYRIDDIICQECEENEDEYMGQE
jgi:hypothetical protein|tara:strand:+ start:220 stop:372 length:153 start_codon:yes stop_codon:yes gene_type:complete